MQRFFLLPVLLIILQAAILMGASQEEAQVDSKTPKVEALSEKDTINRVRIFVSRNNFSAAAAVASEFLQKNKDPNLSINLAALSLILGMESSALEKLNDTNRQASLFFREKIMRSILWIYYFDTLEECLSLKNEIKARNNLGSITTYLILAKILVASLNTTYFLLFFSAFIFFTCGFLRLFGTRLTLVSIVAFLAAFTTIWLILKKTAAWHILKAALGMKASELTFEIAITNVLMGSIIFISLYAILFPLQSVLLKAKRRLHINEFFSAVFLSISFQTTASFLHATLFSNLIWKQSWSIIISGIIGSLIFMFYIWKFYLESYTVDNKIEKKSSVQSQALLPPTKVVATEYEIGNSIRQLAKEENFQEAVKISQSFYYLKNGNVKPEFMMRMIEIKLELDKVSEAKELLCKIEKVENIESKRQQLNFLKAFVKVRNGDLGGYIRAMQAAKEGNAILSQADLFHIAFSEGLFHFQRKEYHEAIQAFSSALKNAKTSLEKTKIKFWNAFSNFQLNSASEIEKLFYESKTIVGLEQTQSYKLQIEAILRASQGKMAEGMKLSKMALDFNDCSATAAFLICRFAIDLKFFGEAQDVIFKMNQDHFLCHRAMELVC